MTIKIGEVIAVNGVRVSIRVFEESSKDTLYYDGERYKGVSIREYISIQRGFRDIVCIVEGEYLDEKNFELHSNKTNYIRKIEVKPIGYFEQGLFNEGIKYLPMIKDGVFLIQEERVAHIFSRGAKSGLLIGSSLKEEIPIPLPWQKLFNSHIGIFGNTGSGKSNTLAKLYTELLSAKLAALARTSKFVILDFNGEYTGSQLVPPQHKSVLNLNTATENGDKFQLLEQDFWNSESLSMLFQATSNTQRPFINRLVNGRARFGGGNDSLLRYIKSTFRMVFTAASPKPESLDLLRQIAELIGAEHLWEILREISWHNNARSFFRGNAFFNADGIQYERILEAEVEGIHVGGIDQFDELLVRSNLQLIRDLLHGYVQFEHIQPLLKRIDSSVSGLRRVVRVVQQGANDRVVTVISLRRCSQEIKKILPLLIAKHFYYRHKDSVGAPPDKTLHLIIDEAHNILSQQSAREHESWKDYRLELFEEIIKEGRKFGMFITLSSQRPADISPTIVSQLHNFFIHRLVNERDLFLVDNTISTLDTLSKSLIPGLSKGCCIVTGTAFDLPIVLQVDRLERDRQPDSEDVDLVALWGEGE